MSHTVNNQPTKNNRPLVSIIMPAYNAEHFLMEAIDSVLAQTYDHWELLIIDDASSDNTGKIALNYQTRDRRIKYFYMDRIGSPSGVRNVGLKLAQGECIAFLDADDCFYPETLERLLTPLVQNQSLSAVYGFAFHIDEDGQPLRQPLALIPTGENAYRLPRGYDHSWEKIATAKFSCLLSSMMLRKSLLEKVGLFNESLCGPEDYEFYVRLFLEDHAGIRCLPFYAYRYRVYGGSLTKDPSRYQRILDSNLQIAQWLFQHPKLPAQAKKYKSAHYSELYRYMARERLLHGQPELARNLVWKGYQDSNLKRMDWLKDCFPLLVRSYLPHQVDGQLVSARWILRKFLNEPMTKSTLSFTHLNPASR